MNKVVKILVDALPYMQDYAKKIIVIKFGGHAMTSPQLAQDFARDVVLLKQCGINPVVVHGGGPQINEYLDKLHIESQFIDGQRVTDAPTLLTAQMVLCGQINKQITQTIFNAGGQAMGLCGIDGQLVTVQKLIGKHDLGLVGEPIILNNEFFQFLINSPYIPVIAPIASDKNGQAYNINADVMAGFIAGKGGAERLLMLSDVAGILNNNKELITDGTINGVMNPKVDYCLNALPMWCRAAVVCDGRMEHVILLELLTKQGVGTLITQ